MKNSSLLFVILACTVVLGIFSALGYYFLQDPCAGQCTLPPYEEISHLSTSNDIKIEPKSYILANGIRAYVLPTTFDDEDQVQVRIISLRGYADEKPEKRGSAELSMDMAWESGVANKNLDQISALLYEEGIDLNSKVFPFYTKLEASFPKDKLDRFFTLATTFINDAHVTESGAETVRSRMARSVAERNHSRGVDFDDIAKNIFFPHARQLQAINVHDVNNVNAKDADAFVHQVLADPSKFIVLVIGDVKPEKVLDELNETIGKSVPKTKPEPSYFDWKHISTNGVKEKRYTFPIHQHGEGLTRIVFPLHIAIDNKTMPGIEFLSNLLEERLRKLLKFKTGSSYGIDVSYEFPLYPHLKPATLTVQFRALPKDNEEIISMIMHNLKELKKQGASTNDIHLVHHFIAQSDDYWKHNNEYWLDVMSNYAMWEWPLETLTEEKEPLLNLTSDDINQVIEKALNLDDYVIVIGKPV